jgi:hypothetical protein
MNELNELCVVCLHLTLAQVQKGGSRGRVSCSVAGDPCSGLVSCTMMMTASQTRWQPWALQDSA